MAAPWIIGEWRIIQDSPEYGCDDNPSYKWFANRYVNGHWTGESLEFPNEYEMRVHFLGASAA